MKLLHIFLATGLATASFLPVSAQEESQRSLRIFEKVTFYDGYKSEVVESDVKDGVLRHTNYLYAKKLTDSDLSWIGDDLRMRVLIGAACDNFDRLGNVSLALVPKGSETYDFQKVEKIEIARFITPFMNKNKFPKAVPYEYNMPGVALILRDKSLRDKYDFWLELEAFGFPYNAQNTVKGCASREDVFTGILDFYSDSQPAPVTEDNLLIPIVMKTTEIFGPKNFNSYTEGACDQPGVPSKTYTFNVPEDLADARILLITSNHGAEEGGEEYQRRHHFVYVDDNIMLDYTPGGVSCEPYRKYNTQGNLIYGKEPDMEWWECCSNWCPGQAVPNREIHLGAVKAGTHTLRLSVPDAQFTGNSGDFYVSAYLQGARKGSVPSEVPEIVQEADFSFEQKGNVIYFKGSEEAAEVAVYDYNGGLLYGRHRPTDHISLEGYATGIYIVSVRTADGRAAVYKAFVK